MTKRSVMLGVLLAMGIAAATFFNDVLIRQTMLIASHLPIAIFGLLIAALLLNPLLALFGRRAMLGPREFAVVAAVALAACGWPGSGFWRYAGTIPSMPAHWFHTETTWQATRVMSYLPGGSGLIAEGHVQDWPALAARIAGASDNPESVLGRVWQGLDEDGKRSIAAQAASARPTRADRLEALEAVNRALDRPSLFTGLSFEDAAALPPPPESGSGPHEAVRWNRAVLVHALPGVVLPAPAGRGALVTGGAPDPEVIDHLVSGHNAGGVMQPGLVPWGAWWPTLRLWGGAALLLGAATLCLSLVVHPQWSKRELLAYPIARFVEEMVERDEGRRWPNVFHTRLFWIGAGTVFAIHGINGLHAYFPMLPQVQLSFNFWPVRDLFPNAGRVDLAYGLFNPRIYFTVIGFAFFLGSSVSLSLGLSHPLFLIVGAFFVANGIPMEYSKGEPVKTNFMRFGAYVGMAIMIAYMGRHYYWSLIRTSLGGVRVPETPRYAVWGMRLFLPSTAAAVWLLTTSGLSWTLALVLVATLLLIWLVLTRIVCETGAFFVTIAFHPVAVAVGLMGFEAIGPTGYLLLGIASWMFAADPREAVMPYLATALRIGDGAAAARPGRLAPWLALVLVASMLVAGFVTMSILYEEGVASSPDAYSAQWVPGQPFDSTSREISKSASIGTLGQATAVGDLERWTTLAPMHGAWGWVAVGLVLVMATAAARLRLPWWPLHPVIFLVWGTYASAHMAVSFLLGWAVKAGVVQLGGARTYRMVKPLMVGLIAGELLAGLMWMVVGATYYFNTGLPPVVYRIFPG